MIEQYTITTTPKYNFPQPTIDTTLPQRFLEQSLHSLKQVQPHQPFQLNQQTYQQFRTLEQHPSNLQLKPTPIPLKPNHQETIIAAVDTSTIKIGETATGIIIAIRGATTWKQNRTYHYTRLGPFIFPTKKKNKTQANTTLDRPFSPIQSGSGPQATPNLMQMPTRLASLLER